MNDKMNELTKWDKGVDTVTSSVYRTLTVVLDRLAIFAAAAVPAMLLGVSLTMMLIVAAGWDRYAAAAVGFSASFGLEGYGLKSLRVRFANPDNDELRKKSHVYLVVGIGLLWFDAAVLIANGFIVGDGIDISSVGIAAAGTAFAIISYHYYGISGIETAVAEKEETAVSERDSERDEAARLVAKQEEEAARLVARQEKIEDQERRFNMIQKDKTAKAKRTRLAQAAAVKAQSQTGAKPVYDQGKRPSTSTVRPDDVGDGGQSQSSSVRLTPVRKAQWTTIYGHLDSGQVLTNAGIMDMLGVTQRTASRIMSVGIEHGFVDDNFDGRGHGEYIKNGTDPHDYYEEVVATG